MKVIPSNRARAETIIGVVDTRNDGAHIRDIPHLLVIQVLAGNLVLAQIHAKNTVHTTVHLREGRSKIVVDRTNVDSMLRDAKVLTIISITIIVDIILAIRESLSIVVSMLITIM